MHDLGHPFAAPFTVGCVAHKQPFRRALATRKHTTSLPADLFSSSTNSPPSVGKTVAHDFPVINLSMMCSFSGFASHTRRAPRLVSGVSSGSMKHCLLLARLLRSGNRSSVGNGVPQRYLVVDGCACSASGRS